jgi:hypothetical protein
VAPSPSIRAGKPELRDPRVAECLHPVSQRKGKLTGIDQGDFGITYESVRLSRYDRAVVWEISSDFAMAELLAFQFSGNFTE